MLSVQELSFQITRESELKMCKSIIIRRNLSFSSNQFQQIDKVEPVILLYLARIYMDLVYGFPWIT